jgi:signal transduction histidine kinase
VSNFLKRLSLGENENNRIIKLPYLVLIILLILSLGVTFLFYQSAKSKDAIRFNNSVKHVQSAIENKINLYIALLKSGRGFIESSDKLNREKFANYVKGLELEKNYAGVEGIGFKRLIHAREKDDLIKQMQSEGISDFALFPAAEREIYQAVIYHEPLNERSRKILGYDMSTDENTRQALERARDSGAPATTAKVTFLPDETGGKFSLLQNSEKNKQDGFLIYLPIYKNGAIPQTVEERRANLIGYIYCPFRAEDFLRTIQGETSDSDVALKIYDDIAKPENLLIQITGGGGGNETQPKFTSQLEENFVTSNSLDVAGRRWVLEYSSLPSLTEQSNISWIPFILLTGVVLSLLLFALTYSQAASRLKLQNTAAELFELEQQKQILLEQEQRARLIAEQANATKDEFISVVSHELRTPLNAIGGWTKILKTENLSPHTKELALRKIEKNLHSQTKLVEELLDFSQIISGKANLETEPVDFSEVFEEVFNEMEPEARAKDITFTKENQLQGQKVSGDRDKLKIIINNLLSNAIKYTPSGGKIETKAAAESEAIILTVKDSGRGISKEFLPFIFDRFRQDDGSTTRYYGGLGLGLAISEHLVKLHHGTIQAASEGREKGSLFTVKLPSVNG